MSVCAGGTGSIDGPVTGRPLSAATSRAIPSTDIASPRFGVTFNSSTGSLNASSSKPAIVRRAPSSRGSHGTSTHSLSHCMEIFMLSIRPKLLEEAQIVLEEQAQIAHAVTEHGEAIDAKAECVAGIA